MKFRRLEAVTSLCLVLVLGGPRTVWATKPVQRQDCLRAYGRLNQRVQSSRISGKAIGAAVVVQSAILGTLASGVLGAGPQRGPGGPLAGASSSVKVLTPLEALVEASKKNKKPETPLKTDAQLAQEAQAALLEWKKKGKFHAPLGEFLVHAEMRATPNRASHELGENLASFHEDLQDVKHVAEKKQAPLTTIEEIRKVMLTKDMAIYCRDLAQLTDFYSQGCGDCDSETRLMLAALIDAGITLPPGTVLGAQLFGDHIQPVLYNRGSREVTSLVTGEVVKGIQGEIYQPALLFHSYLRGKNIVPKGVDEKDLLIQDIDPEYANLRPALAGYRTNTSLKYPSSRGVFRAGNVPKFGSIIDEATGGERGEQGADARVQPLYVRLRALPIDQEAFKSGELFTVGVTSQTAEHSSGMDELIFRNKKDLDQWNELHTQKERKAFLKHLHAQVLSTMMKEPGMGLLLDSLDDPAKLLQRSVPELAAMQASAKRLSQFDNATSMDVIRLTGYGFADLCGTRGECFPALRTYVERFKSFGSFVKENPLVMLKAINDAEPEKRKGLSLLLGVPAAYGLGFPNAVLPVLHLALDPARVSVFQPRTTIGENDIVIDFEASDGKLTHGTFYPPKPKNQQSTATDKKNSQRTPDYVRAETEISALTLAGLVGAAGGEFRESTRSSFGRIGEMGSFGGGGFPMNGMVGFPPGAFPSSVPTPGESIQTHLSSPVDKIFQAWIPSVTKQYAENFLGTDLDQNWLAVFNQSDYNRFLATHPDFRKRYYAEDSYFALTSYLEGSKEKTSKTVVLPQDIAHLNMKIESRLHNYSDQRALVFQANSAPFSESGNRPTGLEMQRDKDLDELIRRKNQIQ